jgi:hypothetical protein
MRTIFSALSILILTAVANDANARMTGKQLNEYCSHPSGAENLACSAYLAGFADGVVMGEPLSLDMTQGKVCLPRAIDGAQLRPGFQRMLRDDPKLLDESANLILGAVLAQAFPCGR